MTETPKYRDDIKGNVKAVINDFASLCSNVIAAADHFFFELDDLPEHVLAEYRDLLTRTEMTRAFKAALRNS